MTVPGYAPLGCRILPSADMTEYRGVELDIAERALARQSHQLNAHADEIAAQIAELQRERDAQIAQIRASYAERMEPLIEMFQTSVVLANALAMHMMESVDRRHKAGETLDAQVSVAV